MARFKYVAYSKENKQLVGYMDAASLEDARNELHKLGLSVLNIIETEETEQREDGKTSFEFEAVDKTGKVLKGTIDATDTFAAYMRLIDEYKFRIHWLVDASLSETEKEQQKPTSLDELALRYDRFKKEEERRNTPWHKRFFGTTNLASVKENIAIIQAQTEKVIEKAREALELIGPKIDPEKRVLIKNKIEELLILKTSTNTERLQVLANDLLRIIKEQQDLLLEQAKTSEEKESIDKLNNIFQDLYSFSRFRDIKVDFSGLGKVIAKLQSTLETLKTNKKEKTDQELLEKESGLKTIKEEIRDLYGRIWGQTKVYFKLFASGKSKLLQSQTLQDIKALWQKVKEKKKQLSESIEEVKEHKEKKKLIQKKRFEIIGVEFLSPTAILYEVKLFSQWLLVFYVLYFLGCQYVLRFHYEPLYGLAYNSLIETTALSYLIVLLFLIYTGLSIYLSFMQRISKWASLGLFLGFVLLFILFLANF